ncbi:MAG: SDR family oxidoreductase [Pseudomonadota bacterium]
MALPKIALVTGASSGIGRAFARLHAQKGGDLIVTARRNGALETLKAELEAAHNVTVTVIPSDLAAPGGADALYAAVKDAALRVDILINNAGFGGHGAFVERALEDDLSMIDLNVKALVALCHRFGADMVAQGGGRILNVSSTAAHMPGPLQATYFATKAFVTSFSKALDEELRTKGVTVTALEPGYVATEFAARADLEGTALIKGGGRTADAAAKIGYDAMERGQLSVINEGLLAFQLNWVLPLLPDRLKLKLVRRMQEKAS